MKVEIKGIEVVMGDKSVKLTILEAQALRSQLNDLFGERITYVPSAPIVIEREVWPWWKQNYPPYTPMWPTTTPNTIPSGIQVYCCTDNITNL